MTFEYLALVAIAFALGGILKGATGAGAPILAVPAMALLVDVPFAVAVFVIPNLISNTVQFWTHRRQVKDNVFVWKFALAGAVGTAIGTIALTAFSSNTLSTSVAVIVLIYVTFRITNPGWKLAGKTANRLAVPVGAVGGILHGATGLSAPVSITFVNAIQLDRKQFIPTMSCFFVFMALTQLPLQLWLGVMTQERFLYSLLATLPLVLFMPVGEFLARHISRDIFDKIILVLLVLLSFRLLAEQFI